MPGDVFLAVQTKRGGRIKGEAAAPDHQDEIEVSSWRWAMQASSGLSHGAASTRRSYTGLTVVKAIDCATSALMSALATNDEVKEAVLTMRKSGGEMIDYFFIKLQDARVTQIEHGCDDNGDTRETVTFSFRKVEVEYRAQEGSGGRGASHVFTDEIVAST